MLVGAEQEDEGLDDPFNNLDDDEVAEDKSEDERAAQLQRDLATQYKSRYLSHTSALCKFAFPVAPSQVMCMYFMLHKHWISCACS